MCYLLLAPRSMPHNELWRISTEPYSPECVEEEFSELRIDGVLRSSSHELRATCCAATLRRAGCPRRRVGRWLPITGMGLPCQVGEPSCCDSSGSVAASRGCTR